MVKAKWFRLVKMRIIFVTRMYFRNIFRLVSKSIHPFVSRTNVTAWFHRDVTAFFGSVVS